MATETLRPNGVGSVVDPGFYLNGDTPFWKCVDDVAPDDTTTCAGWCGNVSSENIGITVTTPAFVGVAECVIDYVKIYIYGSGGLDSGGNPQTPSGTGNTFYLGCKCGNPQQIYMQSVTFTTGSWALYSVTFPYRSGTLAWLKPDLLNFEIGIWYNTYIINAGKGQSPNDNYQNVVSQLYAEIGYSGRSSRAASMLVYF